MQAVTVPRLGAGPGATAVVYCAPVRVTFNSKALMKRAIRFSYRHDTIEEMKVRLIPTSKHALMRKGYAGSVKLVSQFDRKRPILSKGLKQICRAAIHTR